MWGFAEATKKAGNCEENIGTVYSDCPTLEAAYCTTYPVPLTQYIRGEARYEYDIKK